jgi:hypothetical protein
MALREEKRDRLSGPYSIAGLVGVGQTRGVAPMQPYRSGDGDLAVTAATRVERGGQAYIGLITIHGEGGTGWAG